MIQLNGNRNLHALRGALPVLAVLSVVLLSALPLGAQSSSSTGNDQTWTQGTPTASGVYNVYPHCVSVDSDLMVVSTAFTDAVGNWPVGLYPTTLTAIYTSCDYYVAAQFFQSKTPQTVSAGWLAITRLLYQYNGTQWSVCSQDSGWIYNPSSMPALVLSSPGTSSAPYSQAPYTPKAQGGYGPCGAGYYLLYTSGYGWTGSSWLGGGWVSSGYLYAQ